MICCQKDQGSQPSTRITKQYRRKQSKSKLTVYKQLNFLSGFISVSPSVNVKGETFETTKSPVGTAASTAWQPQEVTKGHIPKYEVSIAKNWWSISFLGSSLLLGLGLYCWLSKIRVRFCGICPDDNFPHSKHAKHGGKAGSLQRSVFPSLELHIVIKNGPINQKTLERERMKTIAICKKFHPWFTHLVNIIIIIIILKIAWMGFFKIFPQIEVGLFCVEMPLSTAKYQMLWKLPRPRKNSSLIFVFIDFPSYC